MIFKYGLSIAAALQKKDWKKYESLLKNDLETHMKQHGLENLFPQMNISDELLNSENEFGVYHNPDVGIKMVFALDDVISWFKKMV